MSILDLSHDDYCADRVADQPTLSASIAFLLCTRSPAHAKAAHPKLNPDWQRQEEQRFDVGTAAHAMLLEGRDAVFVVHADSWRTNEAKEARDFARAQGKIPLLAHTMGEVEAMVAAAKEQLAAHNADPPLFTDGKPEQTIVWEEDGVLCRARVDWLRHDLAACDDFKSTSRSAKAASYERALYGVGGDIQACFYRRGLKAVTGEEVPFRWALAETSPPYVVSVLAPSPHLLAFGDAKVARAIALWRQCLENDDWPGYSRDVEYVGVPPYLESAWLEEEMKEAA